MTPTEALDLLTRFGVTYPSSPYLKMDAGTLELAANEWARVFADAPVEAVLAAADACNQDRADTAFAPSAAQVSVAVERLRHAATGDHAEPVGPAEFETIVVKILRAGARGRGERIDANTEGLPGLRGWLHRTAASASRLPLDRDHAPTAAPHEWKRLHEDYSRTHENEARRLRHLHAAGRAGLPVATGLRKLNALGAIPAPRPGLPAGEEVAA